MADAGSTLADIPLDEQGRPDLSSLVNDVSTDGAFRQALTECASLLGSYLSLESKPGLEAMVRDQLVRYAQCMRASGVEGFPDPAIDFDGTTPPFPPEQVPLADPEFGVAVDACAAALAVAP
jgi:hypothetical protein